MVEDLCRPRSLGRRRSRGGEPVPPTRTLSNLSSGAEQELHEVKFLRSRRTTTLPIARIGASGSSPRGDPALQGVWQHARNVVTDAACPRSRTSPKRREQKQGPPPVCAPGTTRAVVKVKAAHPPYLINRFWVGHGFTGCGKTRCCS